MRAPFDIALIEGDDGQVVIHAADCPYVRAGAAAGVPVATLFGCKAMPKGLQLAPCILPDSRSQDPGGGSR
jgi:hypothetical protein